MSHKRIWQFYKPKNFKEQVSNLPSSVKPSLTEAMRSLSESNNPLLLGDKKKTLGFYAIRLNDEYRLSYDIFDPIKKIIIIYRVGDHPFVYGPKSKD